jgi:hypothetical protein
MENSVTCICNIVTDLFKDFLGNGSVNTFQREKWKMCLSGRVLQFVAKQ